MEYRGRAVIVTGASSGIGRQVALDFAARGASLVLAARRADRLDAVARASVAEGGAVEAVVGDVAADGFVEELVARALGRFGRVDVVINNAGISKHKQIYDVTAEDVEYTLRVNLIAPARLTVAALPAMLRQGEGCLVNVSSLAGMRGALRSRARGRDRRCAPSRRPVNASRVHRGRRVVIVPRRPGDRSCRCDDR